MNKDAGSTQDRSLKHKVTASASLFAYIWLVIILMAWTPNMVTVEEGVRRQRFYQLKVCR